MNGSSGNPDSGFYWELEASLPEEGEEVWSLFCYEIGALGAEELNAGELNTGEIRTEGMDEDGGGGAGNRLRHFFGTPPFSTPEEFRAAFVAAYPHSPPPGELSLRQRPTRNWATEWRSHFQPIPVGRRLVVRPPWEAPPSTPRSSREGNLGGHGLPARLEIVIDPGQGFGTGWHPSTALALIELETYLQDAPAPSRMLDVGAGSGILAIAARLLGAGEAWALDMDARVLPEIRRNFSLSGLEPPAALLHGRPDCIGKPFALVTANLTAPVLLENRGHLAGLTDRGGCLIVSGVLESEWSGVMSGFREEGLEPGHESAREGWRAGALRKSSR